jgi:tetratricopeptide (TPR) repeat protein
MYTIDRLMKIKTLVLIGVFALVSLPGFAQMDKPNAKKLKKVTKLYKKKKYLEAGLLTREVINDYPINENLWNLYNQVMYANYSTSKSLFNGLSSAVESEDVRSEERIRSGLDAFFKKPMYDYYNAIYYSSMCLPYNTRSGSLLRTIYVDGRYFTADSVATESNEFFIKGEKEFRAKNFQKAVHYYQKSYDADTSNYMALLAVGDSYSAMKYLGQAAVCFRRAIKMQPKLNVPLKHLADVLLKKGEYEQALDIAKQSLLVYPEEAMMLQIYTILNKQNSGKNFQRNWILRLAPVNTVIDTNRRTHFFDDILHFEHYVKAKKGAEIIYESTGIRRPGIGESQEKYLEVYSWKKMLDATAGEDVPALDYARKMESVGMLAPYVFISLFNVDCYSQYRDFIDHNKELAARYINDFLIVAD